MTGHTGTEAAGADAVRAAVNASGPLPLVLIEDRHGSPRPVLANAVTIMRSALWHGVIGFDEFAQRPALLRPIPIGDPLPGDDGPFPRAWETADDVRVADAMQRTHGCMIRPEVVAQAVEIVARHAPYHPVRDYLESLTWDGVDRLPLWLVDHCGADQTEFVAAVGTRWMISAVARVFEPGCKADAMLVLEGTQGVGKSAALRSLGGRWFTDDLAEMGSKDSAMQTAGAWIIEAAELDAMSRADVARIKAFASRQVDRFRPPYGARVVEVPRQCVFAGTTNADTYLRDETGGRRFWPVRVGTVSLGGLRSVRDQLWAEAVARYRRGEPWHLDTVELQRDCAEAVAERFAGDVWDATIGALLERTVRYWPEPPAGRTQRLGPGITVDEVLTHLDLPRERWDRSSQMRVASVLKAAGWRRVQRQADGQTDRRFWRYEPPTDGFL
jgi:putative DNA primase/helicase